MKLQGSDLEGGGRLIHGLPPFIPHFCKILILGSMPSEASLKAGFYYAHPQNRFFRIIGDYLGRPLSDLLSRQQALNELGIGLFDVIASCYRQGSLDKSIVDPTVNNLTDILLDHPEIGVIATNGALATRLFQKNFSKEQEILGKIAVYHLPSTSPANAAFSLQRLKGEYFRIFSYAHL